MSPNEGNRFSLYATVLLMSDLDAYFILDYLSCLVSVLLWLQVFWRETTAQHFDLRSLGYYRWVGEVGE